MMPLARLFMNNPAPYLGYIRKFTGGVALPVAAAGCFMIDSLYRQKILVMNGPYDFQLYTAMLCSMLQSPLRELISINAATHLLGLARINRLDDKIAKEPQELAYANYSITRYLQSLRNIPEDIHERYYNWTVAYRSVGDNRNDSVALTAQTDLANKRRQFFTSLMQAPKRFGLITYNALRTPEGLALAGGAVVGGALLAPMLMSLCDKMSSNIARNLLLPFVAKRYQHVMYL